jgi:ADP-ribose pyrophosphatase YjhB (NUDIX family)
VKEKQHIGVYGIILDGERILLIKKGRGEYAGSLDLPGGSPEFRESFEETLRREIFEETGLEVRKSRQISTELNIGEYGDTLLRHVGIIYSAEADGNVKTAPDGEDSQGCVWTDINSIESGKDYTPFVVKAVKKIRQCGGSLSFGG